MTVDRASNYADKVVHVIDTYGLPMDARALGAIYERVRESNLNDDELLAEEAAAIFLARHLHIAVRDALRGGANPTAMGGVLDTWRRFVQQVMYRADIGLINRVLYTYEILPLIDEMERAVCDQVPGDNPAKTQFPPIASDLAL
jgi:hypothetical protein